PPAVGHRQQRAPQEQQRQAHASNRDSRLPRGRLDLEVVPKVMRLPADGRSDHRGAAHAVDNTTSCGYLEGARHPSTYPHEEITQMANFKVADLKLADKGKLRIE